MFERAKITLNTTFNGMKNAFDNVKPNIKMIIWKSKLLENKSFSLNCYI